MTSWSSSSCIANDWYVRHARRLLQERAAKPEWKGDAVHEALRKILASNEPTAAAATAGAVGAAGHGRARRPAASRAAGRSKRTRPRLVDPAPLRARHAGGRCAGKFAELAKSDPSPVVRLYLAAALQRLPLAARWAIAEGLLSHADDAADANLPLMDWYGIEPLVPADPKRALALATPRGVPLVRAVHRPPQRRRRGGKRGQGRTWRRWWRRWPGRASRCSSTCCAAHAKACAAANGCRCRPTGPRSTPAWRKAAIRPCARTACSWRLVLRRPAGARRPAKNGVEPVRTGRRATDRPGGAHRTASGQPVARAAGPAGRQERPRGGAARPRLGRRSRGHAPRHPRRLCRAYVRREAAGPRHAGIAQGVRPAAARRDGEESWSSASDVSAFIARQLHTLNDKKISDKLRQVWGEVRDTAPGETATARALPEAADTPVHEPGRPEPRPTPLQQELPAVSQAVRRGRHDRPGPDRLQSLADRLLAGQDRGPQLADRQGLPHVDPGDPGRPGDHRHRGRAHRQARRSSRLPRSESCWRRRTSRKSGSLPCR